MLGIGVLFAVLCAFAKALDTLMNKDVMQTQSATHHSIYRIIFVSPVLLIASLMHWNFQKEAIGYLILYGILEVVNILCHQRAVKTSNPLHIEILSKSKVFFALILSFVLMIDTLSLYSTLGIIVFMVGAVLSINVQNRCDDEKTTKGGVILEIVSVLARTFKPFILKMVLQKNLASTESMAFLSMVVALVIMMVVFRPKLEFRTISVPKYSMQAVIVGLGMLLGGWAIARANTVIVNAIESTTIIFIMVITYFWQKKKYPILTIVGSVISIIGIVLALCL